MAKRKTKKTAPKSTGVVKWKFPTSEFYMMRLESLAVGIIAILIFVVAIFNVNGAWPSFLLTVLFVGIYILVSSLIQKIRQVQETYEVKNNHLHITRKTKFKTRKEKIPLKDIDLHKLDRLFLGGYLVSSKGRHALFFQAVEDLEKFEKALLKGMKKRK
ncbi:hypothetical protein HOD05_00095 [Candidatus Woesearchaeota archaeon]|jgi:hypothetical protein|nr:hypothetical protein [Candidatus Woesearchaeota archaeon]MBT4150813.1 hypothetical protein [Candidatus Woesearchaeota archaeon]MBT4246918.1 hypothetical protein [Candidatus Woesearchaeota archaeon]MBT4433603.1 hypothetical protein [Candidatus Woesearchaeota archaeon]MBT7331785.1 hypothetical protein [Candidatus Woesearchaeota archaeon]